MDTTSCPNPSSQHFSFHLGCWNPKHIAPQTINRCTCAQAQMLPALPQPGTSTSCTHQPNPDCCHTPSVVTQPDYFSPAYNCEKSTLCLSTWRDSESRERSSSTCSKNVLLVWPLHPVTQNGSGLGQRWQSLRILHMAQQYYHMGTLQVKK